MARHKILAATSITSGVANLVLSILLVRPFGLVGVALGTLIPNTIEFCVILPFTMRILGIGVVDALKEIFFPTLSPAILMSLMLYLWTRAVPQFSFLTLGLAALTGVIIYGIGYLVLGASKGERKMYRGIAFNLFRTAQSYLKGEN
jgi:Na+-driven multidrug efflux pump